MRALFFVLLLYCVFCPVLSNAQDVPVRGVVWQQPEDYQRAAIDLRKIQETGFNAVRTGIIEDARVLALAERLGISVYQELPLHFLPADGIVDRIEAAGMMLSDALARSAPYASARDFGVARYVDTADSAACAPLGQLVAAARQVAASGTRFYYSSVFTTHDVCAHVADFVLLDGRDHPAPAQLVRQWYERHETPVGLAGIGTWVRNGSPAGLRNPRSPERQARFLEDRLTELLLDRAAPGLQSVFVYRWRDAEISLPLLARADRDPYRATYGLHSDALVERPAYQVTRGILTGQRATFAFLPGDVALRDWPWVVIFGWASLLLIGLGYAFSPRLRQMVPRYFRAHGFYRDAIREGRDLLLGSSVLLLMAVGLAAGVSLAVGLEVLGDVMAFRIMLTWLPETFVYFLARATAEPWIFALVVAAIYAGAILLWILFMLLLSRTRYGLGPGQVLMLAVWPRWPLMVLMLGALAVGGSGEEIQTLHQVYLVGIIAGLWVLVTLHAVIRATVDYASISRVPPYVPVILFLLNPGIILMITAALSWLQFRAELRFAIRALLYA